MVDLKHIAFLKDNGVGNYRHSYRPLLEHLTGTYNLLKDWGYDEHICLSGLYHSIYGTTKYERKTIGLVHRDKVKAQVGQATEELVYLFCNIDRNELFQKIDEDPTIIKLIKTASVRTISQETLADLIKLETANRFEQWQRRKSITPDRIKMWRKRIAQSRGCISPKAYATWQEFYTSHPSSARAFGSFN